MHEGLWPKLVELDPVAIAQRGLCRYDNAQQQLFITMLNEEYSVDLDKREIRQIRPNGPCVEASYLQQLCILSFLIHACDLPLAHKLVKPEQLEAGQFFFRGHHALPTQELVEAFGAHTDLLLQAGAVLQAKKTLYGDASMELLVLPRLPVTFVIWARDEEFAARATILFDETATRQLPLDALMAVVGLAVEALIGAVER